MKTHHITPLPKSRHKHHMLHYALAIIVLAGLAVVSNFGIASPPVKDLAVNNEPAIKSDSPPAVINTARIVGSFAENVVYFVNTAPPLDQSTAPNFATIADPLQIKNNGGIYANIGIGFCDTNIAIAIGGYGNGQHDHAGGALMSATQSGA